MKNIQLILVAIALVAGTPSPILATAQAGGCNCSRLGMKLGFATTKEKPDVLKALRACGCPGYGAAKPRPAPPQPAQRRRVKRRRIRKGLTRHRRRVRRPAQQKRLQKRRSAPRRPAARRPAPHRVIPPPTRQRTAPPTPTRRPAPRSASADVKVGASLSNWVKKLTCTPTKKNRRQCEKATTKADRDKCLEMARICGWGKLKFKQAAQRSGGVMMVKEATSTLELVSRWFFRLGFVALFFFYFVFWRPKLNRVASDLATIEGLIKDIDLLFDGGQDDGYYWPGLKAIAEQAHGNSTSNSAIYKALLMLSDKVDPDQRKVLEDFYKNYLQKHGIEVVPDKNNGGN